MYLSDERSIVTVPEINRKNALGELFYFFYNEALSILCPRNNVIEFLIFQNLISF
jgi:hypothetical protein